ncbi:uncharacterized protein N7483_000522 [Penicillium malachiteum]|uniref:uncharacterized protein n=1 Tax=Penicillium malachiteum TaxID=1324776 RepID=UPI002547CB1E|nr:uncharacterized protein N7483_000522 [Penicillium malachiteum]KAJ5735397.1 hypothetical protein N7483_000522 [Penicillium malachiteum]
MASTREERLQMRQRGAGTRKIQQVDFGFSFGGPASGPSDPAPLSWFPEPAKPQTDSAPIAPTPPAPQLSQPASPTGSQPQRTPGSARNSLPPRASTYDIPSDDSNRAPRSIKRRKPNPTSEDRLSPSDRRDSKSGHGDSITARNGVPNEDQQTQDVPIPDAPPRGSTNEAPEPPASEAPVDIQMQDASGPTDNLGSGTNAQSPQEQPRSTPQTFRDDTIPKANNTRPRKSRSPKEPLRETQRIVESKDPRRKTRSPQAGKSGEIKNKKSRESQSTSPSTTGERQRQARIPLAQPVSTNDSETSQPEATSATRESPKAQEAQPDTTNETEALAQKQSKVTKKGQGRKGRSTDDDSVPPQTEETSPEAEVQQKSSGAKYKGPRANVPDEKESRSGRKAGGERQTGSGPEHQQPEISGSETGQGPSKPRRGKPGKGKNKAIPDPATTEGNPAVEAVPEPEEEPRTSKSRGKSAKKGKEPAGPKPPAREELPEHRPEPQADPEPEPAPVPSKSRRKAGKKNKRRAEPDVEAEPTEEPKSAERPSAEFEEPQEPEPEPEPEPEASRPKPRGGKRGTKEKRTALEPSTEEQPEAESSRTKTRRQGPREPRGETVPVTVHRLVNHEALGAMGISIGSEDEDEVSPDQLSAHLQTKLPNRGGVNPADVLSQICRETLEKTLTALNTGIENETNAQRRAEWTRKRKAVEAFGSELDGRLLDLSEMLDSNYVLGVRLRQAKRDMLGLRSHLYKVRQEREAISLQMDEVRGKHMAEEAAKTSRTTINNSLHSLELALDRSQYRDSPPTDPSAADLEFMLRTVADDVSSRAPSAHGGLLDQIRAFNTQLETTARRLEGQ